MKNFVPFNKQVVGYDLEVSPNAFMIGLIDLKTDMITRIRFQNVLAFPEFKIHQSLCYYTRQQLSYKDKVQLIYSSSSFGEEYTMSEALKDIFHHILEIKWLVSFNGNHYDDQIMDIFFKWAHENSNKSGSLYQEIRDLIDMCYDRSVMIIDKGVKYFPQSAFFKRSLDLKKIARTEKSLKMIGGSLNYPIIMDFPVNPHSQISLGQSDEIANYLVYDLEILALFYKKMVDEIRLRKDISLKYKVNVMHEDRPGIANELFSNMYCEIEGINQIQLSKLRYKVIRTPRVRIGDVVSQYVSFKTAPMIHYLSMISNEIIRCDKDKITINLPDAEINGKLYTLGAGGLHSQDGPQIFVANDQFDYEDADVSSYYPRLIVTNKLHPKHLSPKFCDLVENVMEERLKAKDSGDTVTADTLKIVINSIFGKTGEDTSWFYSPEVFLGTTINGQLYLLMLIESLEMEGFEVISANTDGIITKIPKGRRVDYDRICNDWMKNTKMVLEFTSYSMYARLSVNSYMAVTPKGKIKTKNEFNTDNDISKSAIATVIPKVMIEFLMKKYLENNPVKIKTLIDNAMQNNPIEDFMWTQKPADKEWKNLITTPNNVVEIQDTVRYLICTNSYKHRVKLFKYKGKSKSNVYLRKTAYVANEYVAITTDFTESVYNNSVRNFIKGDYYAQEVIEKIALMETGSKTAKLTLF